MAPGALVLLANPPCQYERIRVRNLPHRSTAPRADRLTYSELEPGRPATTKIVALADVDRFTVGMPGRSEFVHGDRWIFSPEVPAALRSRKTGGSADSQRTA